jgi:hypothetical protein
LNELASIAKAGPAISFISIFHDLKHSDSYF